MRKKVASSGGGAPPRLPPRAPRRRDRPILRDERRRLALVGVVGLGLRLVAVHREEGLADRPATVMVVVVVEAMEVLEAVVGGACTAHLIARSVALWMVSWPTPK